MKNIDKYITINSNKKTPKRGSLLLSEPLMGDHYFGRSVVLLAEHNDEGSFGVIVNKPIDQSFNDSVPGFPHFEGKLHLGGPIEHNALFYIHSLGDIIDDSLAIGGGLYWGGDVDMIKELMHFGKVTPLNIHFFAGYSGWSPNQLKKELSNNAWVVADMPLQSILTMEKEKMWSSLLKPLGEEYQYWTKFPKNPSQN